MDITTKALLALPAFALLALGGLALHAVAPDASADDPRSLCGGRFYAISTVAHGASPYIRLTAKGVSGAFLVDYGATASWLSARAFPGSDGSLARDDLSLPGFTGGHFALWRQDFPLQPPGGQLGIVGTDLLSQFSAQFTRDGVFLGGAPCRASDLHARGLAPVAQKGFFSSVRSGVDPGRPNVPVVYLSLGGARAWAQIDTGYDDLAYPYSVDVNQPFYDLLIKSGIALRRIADIGVATCDGSETRHVYVAPNNPLVIEDERTAPIMRAKTFYLTLKPSNKCGGIATMDVPAAQISASFLKLFETVVFDPKSETVWLGAGVAR